jgi:hypothetical protein
MIPGGKHGAEDSPLSSVPSAFSAVDDSSHTNRRERRESAENMIPDGTHDAEASPLSSVPSAFSAVRFSSFGSVEIGYTGYLARHELALLYHRKGMNAEAEAEWRAVVEEQPEHLPAWLGLGELYLGQGKWEQLDRVVESLGIATQSVETCVPTEDRGNEKITDPGNEKIITGPLITHHSLLIRHHSLLTRPRARCCGRGAWSRGRNSRQLKAFCEI